MDFTSQKLPNKSQRTNMTGTHCTLKSEDNNYVLFVHHTLVYSDHKKRTNIFGWLQVESFQ